MWVYHVNIEDRKEAINLKIIIIGDSIIPGLEKDETISKIVRDRAGKAIISSQNKLLNVKINIRITIIVIVIFIIIIIIIIILLILSRAIANTDNKVLINLVWQ